MRKVVYKVVKTKNLGTGKTTDIPAIKGEGINYDAEIDQLANEIEELNDVKADKTEVEGEISAIKTNLIAKQDKLTAGANIIIDENNVISASGTVSAVDDVARAEITNVKSEIRELTDDVYSVVQEITRTSQLFDNSQPSIGNLYVKSDNTVVNNSLAVATWVVPVISGKRYVGYIKDKTKIVDGQVRLYLFNDIPSVGSTALSNAGNLTATKTTNYVGFIPNVNGYVMFMVQKSSGAVIYTDEQLLAVKNSLGLEQIDSGYDYEGLPYYITADTKVVKNQWADKHILWMGTSIPEGKDTALGSADAGKSYPEIIGERLGAKVHNISLGSSMIRANTRTGDYVDGYSHNILRALSATLAEKQDLIDNWQTYRQRFRDPDTYPTLTQEQIDTCLNSSYERRLMPYLDGTYPMPDLFVIDHGHNDYKYTLSNGDTDIGIAPTIANIGNNKEVAFDTNMFDGTSASGLESVYGSLAKMNQPTTFKYSVNRNCYWGAINFICTLIYKYNPRARIIFIGNLDDKQHVGLCDAQTIIARDWCSPIIKMWEKLGFGSHYIPNTYNYWGGTGLDLSQKQIYCKDGTHPHSDTTGEAIELFASILTNELKNCY